MIKPTSFRQSNHIYSKPENMTDEECDQLVVYSSKLSEWEADKNANPPFSISCWKLEDEDIEELIRTKRIWVWHVGSYMQPLSIMSHSPFEPKP